jgi:hypothetical protein
MIPSTAREVAVKTTTYADRINENFTLKFHRITQLNDSKSQQILFLKM